MSTELMALRESFVELRQDLKRVKAERDELAAALKQIHDGNVMSGHWTHAETVLTYQGIAKRALAKLEESK